MCAGVAPHLGAQVTDARQAFVDVVSAELAAALAAALASITRTDRPAGRAGHARHPRSRDSAIDALQLAEPARSGAYQLEAALPWVVFTRGRRELAGRARAMAGNVVGDRTWIAKPRATSPVSLAAQAWADHHPRARTQQAIAGGLLGVFRAFPDRDPWRSISDPRAPRRRAARIVRELFSASAARKAERRARSAYVGK